jgi:hypothetical protein
MVAKHGSKEKTLAQVILSDESLVLSYLAEL